MSELSIHPSTCIRCGACVVFAPGIFAVDAQGPARVVRPPATPEEERRTRAAQFNCPTGSVRLGRSLVPEEALSS